jgi:hypothetical protein
MDGKGMPNTDNLNACGGAPGMSSKKTEMEV